MSRDALRREVGHVAATALVLIGIAGSYVIALLPFELGMRVHAAALVTGLAVLGVAHPPRRSALRSFPTAVTVGLAAYAGAALWGSVVGLASGNPLRHVIAQSVSLVLLPWAALAVARDRRADGTWFAATLAWGACLAGAVHLVLLLGGFHVGSLRFKLFNDATFVPAALMALVWTLAWVAAERRPLAIAGTVAAGFLVLGGQTRGQWLGALVSAGVALALIVPRERLSSLVKPAAAAVCLGGLMVIATGWADRSGVTLVAPPPTNGGPLASAGPDGEVCLEGGSRRRFLRRDVDVEGQAALAAKVRARGPAGSRALLVLRGASRAERSAFYASAPMQGSGAWRSFEMVAALPREIASAHVLLRASDPGWCLEHVTLEALPSIPAAWIRAVALRARSLLGEPAREPTLDHRLEETRLVLERWREASWGRRLLGSGLGATFQFESGTWEQGRRARKSETNFIHNYYLFLLYKLGLAGALALTGLLMVVIWTARRDLANPSWPTRAAFATWCGYLLWSGVSPEISNFRMAPVWGAMIAVSALGSLRRRPA